MADAHEGVSLAPDWCRARQRRLLGVLHESDLDQAILVRPEHVQYLTGFRPHRLMSAAVHLSCDGRLTLAAPKRVPGSVAADQVVHFEAQWHGTLRQDQVAAAVQALGKTVKAPAGSERTGVEFSCLGPHFLPLLSERDLRSTRVPASSGDSIPNQDSGEGLVDLEPALWRLRCRKDPDELEMLSRAIACTEAMYARARAILRPGICEIEVFNQLHAAAVEVAGEPLTDLGNDYQCNSAGGPPRPRPAQAGELFVLDLGPAYRGYHADNCRTFALTPTASDEQHQAWEQIEAVHQMIEHSVRPGVKCRQVFEQAQQILDQYRPGSFAHHLGHGIGLFPHEAPHLNPHWDDSFEEGNVFTAEPGLYGEELRAGMRVEDDYLVTQNGVKRLSQFPRGLTAWYPA